MRLGLVAMSGVRAHNEELTRLGLTLPGFVERNKTIASLPSLGLLTLAGMTDEDVDLDYQEVEDIAELDGLPGDYDAVAISSYSAQIYEAYQLADRFRSEGVIVILGGLHVTAMMPAVRRSTSQARQCRASTCSSLSDTTGSRSRRNGDVRSTASSAPPRFACRPGSGSSRSTR